MARVAYYIVRNSPGSFMTGKFVGKIENIIWPNYHSFKIEHKIEIRAF